jgi:hypothetical protein
MYRIHSIYTSPLAHIHTHTHIRTPSHACHVLVPRPDRKPKDVYVSTYHVTPTLAWSVFYLYLRLFCVALTLTLADDSRRKMQKIARAMREQVPPHTRSRSFCISPPPYQTTFDTISCEDGRWPNARRQSRPLNSFVVRHTHASSTRRADVPRNWHGRAQRSQRADDDVERQIQNTSAAQKKRYAERHGVSDNKDTIHGTKSNAVVSSRRPLRSIASEVERRTKRRLRHITMPSPASA